MPFICCVPKCKGNYRNGPKVSVFKFPDDEDQKTKWLNAIHRKGFYPSKYSRVCELHFKCNEIEKESSMLDTKTGKITTSETESQNGVETSFVIKQEPFESGDETPRLVIEKIHRTEDMALSSRNSPPSRILSSCDAALVPEKVMPLVNPDPSKKEETTTAARVARKPARKRKINDGKPDTIAVTPNAVKAKSCRRSKPSMSSKLHPPVVTLKKATGRSPKTNQAESCQRTVPSIHRKRNSNIHPTVGTSKKSAKGSTLPKNDENTTREMFQSLLDCSGNNPLFGSKTTERPGDLFDVFADLIADKLREMDWDDCAYALRTILDVVFKTGKAQQGSEVKSDIFSS